MVPTVNWNSYLKLSGGKLDSIVVSQPKYLKAGRAIFKENQLAG
jgi:hypothetical protein